MTDEEIMNHMKDVLFFIQLQKDSLSSGEQSENLLRKIQDMENKQIQLMEEITSSFNGSSESIPQKKKRRKRIIYKSLYL